MLAPSPRPHQFVGSLALVAVTLAALALVGCQQGIGQRCEQGSDCASGYCGDSPTGAVSIMGKVCTPPPTAGALPDAGADDAAAAEVSTAGGDAALDRAADAATDGPRDVASDGQVSPPDGAGVDVVEAGGAETSGAVDGATTEAGAGG